VGDRARNRDEEHRREGSSDRLVNRKVENARQESDRESGPARADESKHDP
jgi:hypothetical protein